MDEYPLIHWLGLDIPSRLRRVQQIQAAAELRSATIISRALGKGLVMIPNSDGRRGDADEPLQATSAAVRARRRLPTSTGGGGGGDADSNDDEASDEAGAADRRTATTTRPAPRAANRNDDEPVAQTRPRTPPPPAATALLCSRRCFSATALLRYRLRIQTRKKQTTLRKFVLETVISLE